MPALVYHFDGTHALPAGPGKDELLAEALMRLWDIGELPPTDSCAPLGML